MDIHSIGIFFAYVDIVLIIILLILKIFLIVLDKSEKNLTKEKDFDVEARIVVPEQNNNNSIAWKQEREDEKKTARQTENEYLVVSNRDFDEVQINQDSVEKLGDCEGNVDVQVRVMISYVTEYNAKNDVESFEMIKTILNETDRKDFKERMNIIENAFMTCKQNGERDVVLLTSMLLKDLRVMIACHWMAARTTEVKSSRRTKAKQEEPGAQIEGHDGHLDDHDGQWDDHQYLWNEYLGRPLDTLTNISLVRQDFQIRIGG